MKDVLFSVPFFSLPAFHSPLIKPVDVYISVHFLLIPLYSYNWLGFCFVFLQQNFKIEDEEDLCHDFERLQQAMEMVGFLSATKKQ